MKRGKYSSEYFVDNTSLPDIVIIMDRDPSYSHLPNLIIQTSSQDDDFKTFGFGRETKICRWVWSSRKMHCPGMKFNIQS